MSRMGMAVSRSSAVARSIRRVSRERCGGTPKASLNARAKCAAETWLTRANRCTGQASCEAASMRSFARSRRRSSSGSWLVDVLLPKTVCSDYVTKEQIGRASCRERVSQYVSISGVDGTLKNKKKKYDI